MKSQKLNLEIMATTKKALNYVHNTGGNAKYEHFVSDWAPVGHMLFQEVEDAGLIEEDEEGFLHLTEKGKLKREELNDGN